MIITYDALDFTVQAPAPLYRALAPPHPSVQGPVPHCIQTFNLLLFIFSRSFSNATYDVRDSDTHPAGMLSYCDIFYMANGNASLLFSFS